MAEGDEPGGDDADLRARHLFELAPYRAIVEDMHELVVRWRPDGTRLFVNDAYCRLFGATREQMIGTSFWPLVTEEDRDHVRERLRRLSPETPVVVGRHRGILPTGEIVEMEWSDRALFDTTGHIVELQSVGRDITDRVRLERERRRVEQADAVARRSAAIAHDLASVLGVLGMEIAIAKKTLPEGALANAGAALDEGISLVRQLRNATYGRVMKPVSVDLSQRVEFVRGLLDDLIGRFVKLEVDTPPPTPSVIGDPTQIDQVLLNLVQNAADAMPDGGIVAVSTAVVPRAALSSRHQFANEPPPRLSVLRVRDHGPGIPDDVLPRIFEARVTTNPRRQGLGLATVHAIVLAHQASIAIDTSKTGTSVEIAFPFAG